MKLQEILKELCKEQDFDCFDFTQSEDGSVNVSLKVGSLFLDDEFGYVMDYSPLLGSSLLDEVSDLVWSVVIKMNQYMQEMMK